MMNKDAPTVDADHASILAASRRSRAQRLRGLSGFALDHGWSAIGLPLVIVIMLGYFSIQSDRFFTIDNFGNLGRNLAAVALLAIGEGFVILLAEIDISVGAIVGLTTVTTAFAVQQFGVAGFVAAPITGAIVGLLNGVIVARFHVHSVIVTIGTLTAVRGLAYTITAGQPVTGNFPTAFTRMGDASIGPFPIPLIIAAVAFVLAAAVLRFTVFGPMLYATGGNEEAARLAGLPVDRIKVAAFVITGSLAGIAGLVLAARINSGQPNLGQGLELQAIAAAVVGGMALTGGKGTMGGVALGVLVLAILQNGLDITNVSSYAQQVISGIVILVAIVVDRLRGRSRLVAADLESDELAPES
jgi:ribose/xylose/arabinose/galactoside ABC-type transport system permease subunit